MPIGTEPVLGRADVHATALSIASAQAPSGAIPSVPGGAVEPWNLVEAAIALDVAGLEGHAAAAYRFLALLQRADGAWFASYDAEGNATAEHVDTNATAYFASGVLAHVLAGAARTETADLWGVAERALCFVLGRERGGLVPWSVEADGSDAPFALLAGSSSLSSSLRHGAVCARLLGRPPGRFAAASRRVGEMVALGRGFVDRSAFAMDWYYPVLAGALRGLDARVRLEQGAPRFVTTYGVRCRADERWVTTAESAEAALAFARVGARGRARALLASVADKRLATGAYLTGVVYPERSQFPPGEASTYSAAAVLIANDALAGGIAARLFVDQRATSSRRLPALEPVRSTKRPEESASR